MTRTILVALSLSFALAACGPGEPDFTGTWYGTTSASVEGGVPATYNSSLTISRSAGSLDVSGVCPDGSGVVPAIQDGDVLLWNGRLVCPWPPGPACSTSTLTYTSARAGLTSSGDLTVVAVATLAGCGYGPYATTVTFLGRK
jgi:predicted small lipoprotein YifL